MTVQRGFTLIELLVTIAVAGVLIAIAVPSFKYIITKTRLDTTSLELSDAISFARSESVKRNRTIIFCKTQNAESANCLTTGTAWEYWLVKQNANSSSEDDVIKRGNFSSYKATIQITTANIIGNKINFHTDGLARSGRSLLNNAHIIVCALGLTNNSKRTINISAAGQPSISKASGECP